MRKERVPSRTGTPAVLLPARASSDPSTPFLYSLEVAAFKPAHEYKIETSPLSTPPNSEFIGRELGGFVCFFYGVLVLLSGGG